MRKNFALFLLSSLPFLQEYGNISYHPSDVGSSGGGGSNSGDSSDRESANHLSGNVLLEYEKHHDKRSRSLQNKKLDLLKPVVPIVSIEMPD